MNHTSTVLLGRMGVLALSLVLPAAATATSPRPSPQRSVQFVEQPEQAPAWAIPFGAEFWRRPGTFGAAGPAAQGNRVGTVQLQDALERVTHAFRPGAAIAEARIHGRNVAATLHGSAMCLSPAIGQAQEPHLKLRTRRIARGQMDWPGMLELDWYVRGNTAQVLVEPFLGIVQHIEVRRDGVEVTWVFSRSLPGHGDLVIEAEVPGADLVTADEPGPGRGGRLPRATVGKAFAVDARGLSWQLPLRLAGDQFIISVPDAVLNEAMYPLAVDPLITPEFALDVPVDGPSPATRSAPVIAANDSGFLVAWCQGKSEVAESGVFAARIAPSGLLLDPQGIRVSGHAGEQSVCAVAAIDDMFLVTWAAPRGNSATDWDVLGARVLADGTVLDSPLPIGALAGSVQNSPAVAGNGQNFLVTWRDSRNTGIYGTIVTREGSLSTTNGISVLNATYDQYTPAVAALGTNYLVVAQDYRRSTSAAYNSDVYGARVSGLGMLLDPVGFPICTNAGSQFRPAVAADGTNYLVVWEDYDVDGSNIRAARVTGEGVVLDPVALVVSHAVNNQGNPTVTADGGGFVVAWQDHRESTGGNFEARIRAARVSGDGTVLDAAGVPVCSAGGGQNLPCITSRGQDWLAVWQDLRSNPDTVLSDIFGAGGSGPNPGAEMKLSPTANAQISPVVARLGETYLAVWADNRHDGSNSWDICGLRLDATGNPLDAAPFWICAAPGRQSDPSIASGENRFLVVWSDWRNSPATLRHADVYGTAVSPDGAVLHPGGKPICTATNDQSLPAVAAFGTNFLVTWQDSRSNQPPSLRMDIFASRVTETGVVLDQGGLPVCTHLTIQTNPVVAANRDLALVVWTDYRSSATYPDIYGARLTPDGTVLESNGFPICLAANTTQYLPAVATDGSGFLVVWADSRSGVANAPDIYGTEVTASGAVSSLTGLGIRTGPGPQTVPELAFNGHDYLVAWQTAPSATGTFDIHAVQVESLTAPLVQAGVLPVTTDSTTQLAPALAPGPDGRFLVLWQSLERFVPRITGSLVDSGAVPRLDSPNIAADGQFQFRFRGSLGQRYDIERSADLQQWTRIMSFTNAAHSSLLADPEVNTGGRRFYRALLVP